MPATFEFSAPMQRKIVAVLYRDKTLLDLASSVISPDHFDNQVDATYMDILLTYNKEYPDSTITHMVLFEEIRKGIGPGRP